MRQAVFALIASIPWLNGPVLDAQDHPRTPCLASESEASSNFDSEDVEPVLLRISKQITSGFSGKDAKALASKVKKQMVSTEQTYTVQVVFDKSPTKLRIVAYMSGIDAPDIWFFTSSGLAKIIDREITAHMDSVGK